MIFWEWLKKIFGVKGKSAEVSAAQVPAPIKAEAHKPVEKTKEQESVSGPKPVYWKPLVINGVNVHPRFEVPEPYTHLHPYDFVAHFVGNHEKAGSADNVLLAHTHEHSANLGAHSDRNDYHDEVPYCASGMNWTADGTGSKKTQSALASSFDNYPGKKLKKGDKVPKSALCRVAHPGGHITMANKDFVWTGHGTFEGLGFNQGNAIKVSVYDQAHIVSIHLWEPLPGTLWAPIGTHALPATGGPVVEVEPCVNIPFIDGPEGACTNTVTHKAYLVPADKWKDELPIMIMLRARDWTKIKLKWLEACHGSDDCNVYVHSIDETVQQLNKIAEAMIKAKI